MNKYSLTITDYDNSHVVKKLTGRNKNDLVRNLRIFSRKTRLASRANKYTLSLTHRGSKINVDSTPVSITKLAQALDVAMEKEELMRAILNWEPTLKNAKEWLSAVKNSDTWSDIKSIWDALWRTKDDIPEKQERKTDEYKEWVDFGGDEDEPLELASRRSKMNRKGTGGDDAWKKFELLKELMGTDNLLDELMQAMSSKEANENFDHIMQMNDIHDFDDDDDFDEEY